MVGKHPNSSTQIPNPIPAAIEQTTNPSNTVNTIYTIGHSTRSIKDFIALLQSFEIKVLADIRSFPGSKRHPQFNSAALERSLKEDGIAYIHMPGLGGKRPINPGSTQPFGGYTDYMKTTDFVTAIGALEKLAAESHTAYMCAEADWQHCHRSMVSDHLRVKGWIVMHIMDVGKSMEHPLRESKPIQGNLF